MTAKPILAGGQDLLPEGFTVMAVIVEGFAVACMGAEAIAIAKESATRRNYFLDFRVTVGSSGAGRGAICDR
jgi:hypothetical protein